MKPFLNWITVVWVLLRLCPPALADCEHPLGRLVSLQGTAQMQVSSQTTWAAATTEQTFCPGDLLQIEPNSRAAVVLNNHTILRLDQNTTIHFVEPSGESFSLIHLVRGFLHIFSHKPRSLHISTPYINGAVEGTEFLVQVDAHQARFTVFEGAVLASNEQGELRLTRGQSAVAGQGQAPQLEILVRPRDAAQWTLYYPHIFDSSSNIADRSAWARMSYAAEKLALGQVAEASAVLSELLQLDPANSDVLALLAIQSLVQNNRAEAKALVDQAIQANPDSATAALARSYVQQADFKLDDARATLAQAASAHPNNAEIQARLAEMQLAGGDTQAAYATALAIAQRNPDNSRSQMVLGFVHLARVETNEALHTFKEAIRLDPVQAMAHLGVGLALMRKGQIEEGRAAMELAAALDPGNALIRSYLGKAYFEEKRGALAQREYAIAKELDPADPTPWFYDALRKQSENRPIDALHDLQRSMVLNDNRAVYRSRLLLDSDLATRNVSLGSLYANLGFNQLSLEQGRSSLNADPGNASAHRLLADTYLTQPRHEIARVSELLQAQLLQPLNTSSLQPQLAESKLFLPSTTGPSLVGYNEFSSLFLRNQMTLQASGMAGNNATIGDEVIQSGIWDAFSYSVGQFHYQTDGIRANNDLTHDLYNAYFQAMLTPRTSLMTEMRLKQVVSGDLDHRFDPNAYYENFRNSSDTTSWRIGGRHDLNPGSTLIGTAIVSNEDGQAKNITGTINSLDLENQADNFMVELQHLYKKPQLHMQSGASTNSADESENFLFWVPSVTSVESSTYASHVTLYSYAQVETPFNSQVTLGLSENWLDSPIEDKNELNPKVGLSWRPRPGTTLRCAYFQTLQRRFTYSQTIEPTQVAGFNQFYDDFEASSAWNSGIGLDQAFGENWFGGLSYLYRNLEVPIPTVSTDGLQVLLEDTWQEELGTAYLYWAPTSWLTLGLQYSLEKYSHEQMEGPLGISSLTTNKITPAIHIFHPCGVSVSTQANYVDQHGDFGSAMFGFYPDKEQFWTLDLALNYRLPQRYGLVTVEIKNLLDEQFRFLDTDPSAPRLLPEQQIWAKFTLVF